ncbi:MAG: nucleotide exchange factor GrpE [Planctomycetes bacterium]|nr:nucleotide exchange factor GrpE [Planctomycetota bacterium]
MNEPANDQHEATGEPAPADDATEQIADGVVEAVSATEFAALKLEARELKDRLVRLQAEFDNARKRLRREADEAGTRAIARMVKPVLTEMDNLSRAIAAAKPEAFAEFATGVSMIRENLGAALTSTGLELVPSEGVFNPAFHEVIAEVEQADAPRGTIVEVHRPGYRLKDQLVRAAQVVVTKPPPIG